MTFLLELIIRIIAACLALLHLFGALWFLVYLNPLIILTPLILMFYAVVPTKFIKNVYFSYCVIGVLILLFIFVEIPFMKESNYDIYRSLSNSTKYIFALLFAFYTIYKSKKSIGGS